jgi:hypothetical protein
VVCAYLVFASIFSRDSAVVRQSGSSGCGLVMYKSLIRGVGSLDRCPYVRVGMQLPAELPLKLCVSVSQQGWGVEGK